MNKKEIKKAAVFFAMCSLGVILLHFILPVFLGFLANAFALTILVLLYDLAIQKGFRISAYRKSNTGKSKSVTKMVSDPNSETKEDTGDDSVSSWYQNGGQERLERIIEKQKQRGFSELWIRYDGVCNIKAEQGYRRAGSLPCYPGSQIEKIEALLRKDGKNTMRRGRYLHVSW